MIPTNLRRDLETALDRSGEALARLAAIRSLRKHVRGLERPLVAQARREGHSWQDVATALDITRQAAQQRFGNRY